MLIVALAVAAVLAQPVSADAKDKGQNKGAARLHGGASAQDILRRPGAARAIRVTRRDRRDDARTVQKLIHTGAIGTARCALSIINSTMLMDSLACPPG